jgi:hypothetical protein
MQMTVSRGNPVVLKFTKGTIGHLSKRAFQIELDDDHEACQLIKTIFPDFGPCEFENKRHDQIDLVVSPETNTMKVLDPAMSRPLSKYPETLLQASPKDFISHDNSIMDTTQKEQEGKHTSLVDSHDNFLASEPNPTLYSPKILASMGTGHPSDVLLQDQEPPGHEDSKSSKFFNSKNATFPTMQITPLYGDAADATESAGHPPAAKSLRLADPDLTRQKIGRALHDMSNSKERAGYPETILLQADDGGGGDDDGNGGGGDGGGGDSGGGGGGGGD